MKNYFHEDVDSNNIQIAKSLFDDSQNITKDVTIPTFSDVLQKQDSKHNRPKANIIKWSTAIAACLVIVFGIATILSTNSFMNTNNNVIKASNYEKVYEKLASASASSYSEFGILYDGELYGGDSDGNLGVIYEDSQSENKVPKASSSSKDYYETNHQTENVQEADIVKTDGNNIYTAHLEETKITITSVDGLNMKHISKLDFDFDSKLITVIEDMYVYQDKLVIIGRLLVERADFITSILIYDVKDPKSPKLINQLTQDGTYDSSRMVDNHLYTITRLDISIGSDITKDGKFEDKTPEDLIPNVNGCPLIADDIYLPINIETTSYTIITSVDVLSCDDFVDHKSILGATKDIYASQNNIYILNNTFITEDISDTDIGKKAIKKYDIYDKEPVSKDLLNKEEAVHKPKVDGYYKASGIIQGYETTDITHLQNIRDFIYDCYKNITIDDLDLYKNTEICKKTAATEIIKFSYLDGKINYIADTTISGHYEDNLSFDEKDGYLRCVTTEDSTSSISTIIEGYLPANDMRMVSYEIWSETLAEEDYTNNVYVLDDKLRECAHIHNLAKGEKIYSSRFLGDFGYFVTYKEIDPLFTVDFTDMENPKIIGELKIPGVSYYLHFYNENQLLGFGIQDKKDTQYLKLEMYNIENNKASVESKYEMFDYDYSEGIYDYKALLVDPNKNLFGFVARTHDSDFYYVVYQYVDKEFIEKYKVPINMGYAVRSLYIDNYLYIVNVHSDIRAIDMNSYKSEKDISILEFDVEY